MKTTNEEEFLKLKEIRKIIDIEIHSNRLKMLPKRFKNVKILNAEVVDANVERLGGFKWPRPVLYFNTEPQINESGYVITHIRPQWFYFSDDSIWKNINNIKKRK
jgi:hypothetical protein